MKKNSQLGFALPQVLLIVVGLLMVGGTGYYVYRANQDINKNLDNANSTQNTPQKSGDKTTNTTEDSKKSDSNIPDGWVKFEDETTGMTFYHPADFDGKFSVKRYDIDEDVAVGFGAPVWWRYNASNDSWKTYQAGAASTGTNIVKEPSKNTFTLTKNKVDGKATFTADLGEGGGSARAIVFPYGKHLYRINYPMIDWANSDASKAEATAQAHEDSVEQLIKTIKF